MKKLMIFILTLSLLLAATACGTTAQNETTASGGTEATTTATGTGTGNPVNNVYDIQGEITEIIGNEVTLKLMEMSATETESSRVPGSGMGKNSGGSGVPAEKNYTGEERTIVIPVGTPLVMRVTAQSTGTTAESGTGTGPVEQEIGLNQLTKGMILRIRYLDDDKTIEKILAQKPRT